jgi:hypothetical protein
LKTPKRYVQSGTRADGKLTGTETLVWHINEGTDCDKMLTRG